MWKLTFPVQSLQRAAHGGQEHVVLWPSPPLDLPVGQSGQVAVGLRSPSDLERAFLQIFTENVVTLMPFSALW